MQNNIDGQIKELTEIIVDFIEKIAHLRLWRINRKFQWMTNQVKKMIKNKKNGLKKLLKNFSEENHKKYRQKRNLATKVIKNACLSYYDNLTKKKDKTNKKSVNMNTNPENFSMIILLA